MDDPVAAIVLWFLMALVAAVAIPIAAVIGLVFLIGLGLWKAIGFGYDLVQGDPVERELGRITSERQAAIHDIVALRNEGERQMRAIADEGVIERSAGEWRL